MSQNPIFGAQFAKDFWEHTNILNVLTLLPHNMSSFFILVCRISALDSEMFCLYTEHHLLHETISRHAYVYSCIYTCFTHVYTHREIERRFGDCQDSPTWIFFSKPEYLIPSEKNYTVFWGGKRNFCHLIIRLYDFHWTGSLLSMIFVKFMVWHGISELLEPWEQKDTVKPQIPKSAKVK